MRAIKIILALVLLAFLAGFAFTQYRAHHRAAWKAAALARLAEIHRDSTWTPHKLADLKKAGPEDSATEGGWFTSDFILLKNGEWLAFTNVCRKQDWRIDDLLLGYGSDGQWYYSTYHFCMGAIVFRMRGQPASIAGMVRDYHLRPFDGKSDICLGKTWP